MPSDPQTTYRTCKHCSREATLAEGFDCTNRERGWYRHECKRCTRQRINRWWHSNPDAAKAIAKRQYETRREELRTPAARERINARVRTNRTLLRDRVYAAYGSICACCGEADPLFLTLDHVHNDGHRDRKGRGAGGFGLLYRLIREGFPATFQLLCFNCNLGRARNGGVCPHLDKEGSSTIPKGSTDEAIASGSAHLRHAEGG